MSTPDDYYNCDAVPFEKCNGFKNCVACAAVYGPPKHETDCRNCVHCVGVKIGESIECDAFAGRTISWDIAIGTSQCPDFTRREAEGHGEDSLEAGTKDTNPKDAIGSTKLPLDLVPPLTVAYASLAHLNGALKYGKANWRKAGVRASIYAAAAKRHLDAWLDGEECDPDDGVPHLSAVLACVGIVLDARACGKLTDDRPLRNPGYRDEITALTAHVKRLQELHKDKSPKHFTIKDSEVSP